MNRTAWIGIVACGGIIGLAGMIASGIPASQAAPNVAPCPPAWRLVAGADLGALNRGGLAAVAAGGSQDVWAVGGYGNGAALIEHWDGQRWATVPVSSTGYLFAVTVAGPRNVWAVGGAQTLHWDGTHWAGMPVTVEPDPAGVVGSVDLRRIAAVSKDDVWAVGSVGYRASKFSSHREPLTLHWDGTRWNRVPISSSSGTLVELYSVAAIDSSDIWAVGYQSDEHSSFSPISAHWNGTRWDVLPMPSNGPEQQLRAITARGKNDVWVVGDQFRPAQDVPGAPAGYYPLIEHWDGATWSIIADTDTAPTTGSLIGVSAAGPSDVWAVGELSIGAHMLTLHWDGIRWQQIPSPTTNSYEVLTGVAIAGPSDVWAVGDTGGSDGTLAHYSTDCLLPTPSLSVVPPSGPPTTPVPTVPTPPSDVVPLLTPPPGGNPTARIADPHDPQGVYFPEVGHHITEQFYDYWRVHGGLTQFGYPLTEEFLERNPTDGRLYRVQYFERNRFEWHTENAAPYNILLGLLASDSAAGRMGEAPFRRVPARAEVTYFAPTGHTLGTEFAAYWQDHDGLPVYGFPISEPFREVSPTDGKPYLVQYFQRNRLEYHPELPAAYHVSLGLLGADLLRARGWLP